MDRKVDLTKRLSDVVANTPFWRPFEQYRLGEWHKRFNELSDSIYRATDGIAALLRCRERTQDMGMAVIDSMQTKQEWNAKLMYAGSVKEAIDLLRSKLTEHRQALGG